MSTSGAAASKPNVASEEVSCPLRAGVTEASIDALTALTHPNVRRVLSARRSGVEGRLCLTLARDGGLPLMRWWSAPRAPSEQLAAVRAVFDQICLAVAAAHRLSPPLAHGALTPEHVVVERRGALPLARVHGFGVYDLCLPPGDVRLVPELDPADPRATTAGDVFALGVMLATLLAGAEPPLHADAAGACAWVAARAPLTSPSLLKAIARCMSAQPSQRPESVAELRALLRTTDWSPREPVVVAPAPRVEVPPAAPQREEPPATPPASLPAPPPPPPPAAPLLLETSFEESTQIDERGGIDDESSALYEPSDRVAAPPLAPSADAPEENGEEGTSIWTTPPYEEPEVDPEPAEATTPLVRVPRIPQIVDEEPTVDNRDPSARCGLVQVEPTLPMPRTALPRVVGAKAPTQGATTATLWVMGAMALTLAAVAALVWSLRVLTALLF